MNTTPDRPHSAKDMTRRVAATVEHLHACEQRMISQLRQAGVFEYVNEQSDRGGKWAMLAHLVAPALIYRTHRRWREGTATVYSLHPDMVREACDVEHERVAAQSLEHLFHVNPLLVFPEPVRCVNVDGSDATLVAVYVTGLNKTTGQQCDTDDADRTGIRLVLVTRQDRDGREITEHAVVHLDTRTDWFDVEHEVREAARRQVQLDPMDFGYEQHLVASRSKLVPALAVLLYVTSNDMDHEPAPTRPADAKRKGRRQAARQQHEVVNVGWRLGPALADERRTYERTRSSGGGGGTKAPHPRRAHYAHRWADQEHTVYTHRWFRKATYINRPDVTGDPVPTIVTVGQTD